MTKYKISVSDECIGCGACTNVCDNFKMNDENKSVPVKKEVDDIGCNQDAADSCPVSAISVEEIK